jgi:hypothetical protein
LVERFHGGLARKDSPGTLSAIPPSLKYNISSVRMPA